MSAPASVDNVRGDGLERVRPSSDGLGHRTLDLAYVEGKKILLGPSTRMSDEKAVPIESGQEEEEGQVRSNLGSRVYLSFRSEGEEKRHGVR